MLQIKSKYKVCKRLGSSVFEQCQTQKFALSEARSRGKTRGKRGKRGGVSDYGKQLLEKQKMRYMYGLSERQLTRYVQSAMEANEPMKALQHRLESRLDNVVYRIGLAPTRRSARQMVSHGHITVNGTKMTVPSHQVKVGDTLAVREGSKESPLFSAFREEGGHSAMPNWCTFDGKQLSGEITGDPAAELADESVSFAVVLEYYSR